MTTATAGGTPRWLPISPTAARGIAYLLTLASIGCLVFSWGVFFDSNDGAWTMPMVAFVIVGATILHRWPTHPVGWLFLWLGALGAVTGAGSAFVYDEAAAAGTIPVAPEAVRSSVVWLSLAAEACNTATIAALVPLSLLLFPDGRLPSRRWRFVPVVAGAAAVLGGVAALLNGGWGGDPAQAIVVSPLADLAVAPATSAVFFPLMMSGWVAGAVGMITRYRRSQDVERVQLKWLAASAVCAIVAVLGAFLFDRGAVTGWTVWLAAGGMAAPAVGAGIAILRHQLFDIDVVIRRSLIVGGLVIFVTGFYVAIVVGVGRLLGTHGSANPLLAVTATAAVAIAFQPVQQRLTRWANRLVYGQRSTPYEVLTAFARDVAAAGDPDALLERAAGSLADGTGALEATVWMRVGDRLSPAAHHPPGEAPPEQFLESGGALPALPGSVAVEVRHAEELLGAVTLTKPRGEPATPTDTALAQRLADQIGVALTNLRLTAELQQRAAELAASRRRVLTAADDERRALERRLSQRSGQRLVALKTGLAVAQRTAVGAPKTREQLETVQSILDDGIDELHRLTRGLYPPLLEAEGLAVALRSAAERTGLDVHVDADGVGRLPVTHETAIYFCVLEALANVAKHADTSSVRITLRRDDDAVAFSVVDAGRGFDRSAPDVGAGLANMRDRISALDGTVTIQSRPGRGTTVAGSVPVAAEVTA